MSDTKVVKMVHKRRKFIERGRFTAIVLEPKVPVNKNLRLPYRTQSPKTYVRQHKYEGPPKPRLGLVKPRTQEFKVPVARARIPPRATKEATFAHTDKFAETVSDSPDDWKDLEKKSYDNVPSEGLRELDPLVSRVLEEELRDIMIKMWQELPDDSPSEVERYAVDALRNEIGDSFSRVLGLNVTKRLLNIHNTLFVKLRFSCKPHINALKKFLDKYRIDKFKRIDKTSNVFAAQMDTIKDFDVICSIKHFQCGDSKVTVTPCYRFTHCPEGLRTIYDDKYDNKKTLSGSKLEISENEKKDEKPQSETENTDYKVGNNHEEKENVVKGTGNKKEIIENKEQKTENKEEKVDNTKEITETKNEKIENNIKKTEKNEKKGEYNTKKETETRVEQIENSVQKVENKIQKDDTEIVKKNSTIDKHDNIEPKKENTKKSSKVDLHKVDYNLDVEIPENPLEGEEELDDEDILALMSEGVVLDECSGSDDE